MLTRRGAFAAGLAAILVVAMAGCSSAPKPGIVALSISAGGDINPDATGQATPVVVRVYQLAADAQFQSADFFQLYDKEQAVLGADLLGREEVTISPGGARALSIPLKPTAQFIGIAVAFRDIDRASWRAVVAVPPHGTTQLKAMVQNLRVTLSKVQS